jgi:hypothetical protein
VDIYFWQQINTHHNGSNLRYINVVWTYSKTNDAYDVSDAQGINDVMDGRIDGGNIYLTRRFAARVQLDG